MKILKLKKSFQKGFKIKNLLNFLLLDFYKNTTLFSEYKITQISILFSKFEIFLR